MKTVTVTYETFDFINYVFTFVGYAAYDLDVSSSLNDTIEFNPYDGLCCKYIEELLAQRESSQGRLYQNGSIVAITIKSDCVTRSITINESRDDNVKVLEKYKVERDNLDKKVSKLLNANCNQVLKIEELEAELKQYRTLKTHIQNILNELSNDIDSNEYNQNNLSVVLDLYIQKIRTVIGEEEK